MIEILKALKEEFTATEDIIRVCVDVFNRLVLITFNPRKLKLVWLWVSCAPMKIGRLAT